MANRNMKKRSLFAEEQAASLKFTKQLPSIKWATRQNGTSVEQFYSKEVQGWNMKQLILIPFHKLHKLSCIFPNLRVRRYDASGDSLTRKQVDPKYFEYDSIIDTLQDEELWKLSSPITTGEIEIDVVLHPALETTIVYWLLDDLVSRTYCWGNPRSKRNPSPEDPHIVISPIWGKLAPYRLPVKGGGMSAAAMDKVVNEVVDMLQYVMKHGSGCGWFKEMPEVSVLNFETDPEKENVLCEAGTEHLYPLPVSSEQVYGWIKDGSVERGRVLLVKGRFDLDREFLEKYSSLSDLDNKKIATSGAEMAVFYCNGANSHSPEAAIFYIKWRQEHYPESKQRVTVLNHGINGLFDYLSSEVKLSKAELQAIFEFEPYELECLA